MKTGENRPEETLQSDSVKDCHGPFCDTQEYTKQYLPLRDVVFHTLRESILKGEMEPGERLMEIHLADRLGVSRTPIREAIRMLELEGLVTMVPRRGAQVAQISPRGLKDVLEVRQALEALAMELACERITEEEIDSLRRACDAFREATGTRDAVRIARADVELHDIIVAAGRNDRLAQMVENLSQQMYRYRLEHIRDENQYPGLIEEHEEIFRCIRARDREAGAAAIRKHVRNQERFVLDRIKEKENKAQAD